jgi:hypothetical protein
MNPFKPKRRQTHSLGGMHNLKSLTETSAKSDGRIAVLIGADTHHFLQR